MRVINLPRKQSGRHRYLRGAPRDVPQSARTLQPRQSDRLLPVPPRQRATHPLPDREEARPPQLPADPAS